MYIYEQKPTKKQDQIDKQDDGAFTYIIYY